MFEAKWLKSVQKKVQPFKVIAENNFLAEMNNLEKIHESQALKERDTKREETYEQEYSLGLQYLSEFAGTSNTDDLKKAANKFFDALKCKKSNVEPYYYLSYIFYVSNQRNLAIEYLKIAKTVDPNKPELIKIQQLIYANS